MLTDEATTDSWEVIKCLLTSKRRIESVKQYYLSK